MSASSSLTTLNYPSTQNGTLSIDFVQLKKASMTLRALNHKLRLNIVQLIDERKKLTVTEIYIKLRMEQSVASQHLAILRRANIVLTEREGKFIYYTLNYGRITDIMHFIKELLS
ncbi:MAG: metalloregulator ArsR/SmtB family transcription factor [Chitinophagaceae bacterium]